MSDSQSVYGSKYVNIMGPLQTDEKISIDDASPALTESQTSTRNENAPSKRKDSDYEPVMSEGRSLEDSVAYEAVSVPQSQEDCVGLELAPGCSGQRVYQNVPNNGCEVEEHLYEVVQVRSRQARRQVAWEI
jgi:hypothetical protein